MSRLAHQFDSPDPPHRMIAPNAQLAALRSAQQVYLGMTLALSIMTFPFFFLTISQKTLVFTPVLISPLFQFFAVILYTILIHHWQPLEHLRLVAAQGDQHLRASQQPHADFAASCLPMTINTYPLAHLYFTFFTVVVVVFLAICNFFLWPLVSSWLWFLLIDMLIVLLFSFVFVICVRSSRRPIEVNEAGIKSRDQYKKAIFMSWRDVRLFARYPQPELFSDSQVICYELASASHSVCWTWMPRRTFLTFLVDPALFSDEYSSRLQALCSLIVARTGLPLYDLSQASISPENVHS
jgi:hypothetical protein